MWGTCVIIPLKLRNKVLEEIHVGHIGIVKMKALSRSFLWWPGLDNEIEQLAKPCAGYQINQKLPTKSSLCPWEWPSAPWECIHIDFARPFLGHMFLIAVDTHSNWPEVQIMETTTASKTVDVLWQTFGRFGAPKKVLVTMAHSLHQNNFKHLLGIMVYSTKHQYHGTLLQMA